MKAAKGSPDYAKDKARGMGSDMYDLMPEWPSASTNNSYGGAGLGHGSSGGSKIAPKKAPKKDGYKKSYSKDHPINSLDDIRKVAASRKK